MPRFAPVAFPAARERGCLKMGKEEADVMQREESFGGRRFPASDSSPAAEPTHGSVSSGRAAVGTGRRGELQGGLCAPVNSACDRTANPGCRIWGPAAPFSLSAVLGGERQANRLREGRWLRPPGGRLASALRASPPLGARLRPRGRVAGTAGCDGVRDPSLRQNLPEPLFFFRPLGYTLLGIPSSGGGVRTPSRHPLPHTSPPGSATPFPHSRAPAAARAPRRQIWGAEPAPRLPPAPSGHPPLPVGVGAAPPRPADGRRRAGGRA